MSEQKHLVDVRGLKEYFPVKSGMMNRIMLKAVDDVSFTIDEGETLGLVGESGCGKTTVGRTLLHLYKPTAGEVYFDGRRVTEKNIGEFRKDMQIVFQDPYSSLNPRMTVSDIIGEPLDIHKLYSTKKERADRISELLTLVGLNSEHATRYAHEFSGGQRQRIGIARALAVNPRFIVCDEPVSALDVSIQAQIINTFEDLQQKLAKIEVEIAKVKKNLSNLTSTADEVVATCCKLGSLWSNSELELCQKIQNLLFPSGIFWDKEIENYRTSGENYALNIIHNISISYENKKEGELENSPSKIALCG